MPGDRGQTAPTTFGLHDPVKFLTVDSDCMVTIEDFLLQSWHKEFLGGKFPGSRNQQTSCC